ncbi:metal ABC transporter ATP-binding protein [Candidatus Woesebacteria bacterium]|nr:MAG: metal ABC transporter ATP-binding protein [Candidatus Woesebacteria bacterium]
MTALQIDNLTVKYPGYAYHAVENVSFQVEENTINALIGPNGSGKSTVIKAILGLLEYEGTIQVFGKNVNEVYSNIGFVPQRFTFDPTFPITVGEFVAFSLMSLKKNVIKEKIKKTLERVDAYQLITQKLSSLSGGQLQRVLLARALINDPKLLILDEPEAGVDVGGEQTFYDLIESLVKKQKVTALIASHELDVVFTYASQVICLNKTLLCSGKPQEVLDRETFENLYGRDLKFYGHRHVNHNHKHI